MLRFFGAATLILAASTALAALDFDRQRQVTPDLTITAYLAQQRANALALLVPAQDDPTAKSFELSRMSNIDSIEHTSGTDAGATFFDTINRTIYGTKSKPTIGVGMCRVEGGRKTCSPFAD